MMKVSQELATPGGNFKLSQESLRGGNVQPVMPTVLSPTSVDLTSETTLTVVR